LSALALLLQAAFQAARLAGVPGLDAAFLSLLGLVPAEGPKGGLLVRM